MILFNSSILDIEHSPYYIALGSPQTHKVRYIYIYIYKRKKKSHCHRLVQVRVYIYIYIYTHTCMCEDYKCGLILYFKSDILTQDYDD